MEPLLRFFKKAWRISSTFSLDTDLFGDGVSLGSFVDFLGDLFFRVCTVKLLLRIDPLP
jgi:hypothetical protein